MAHCPVLAIYRNDNIRPYADTLAKRNIKRGPWLNMWVHTPTATNCDTHSPLLRIFLAESKDKAPKGQKPPPCKNKGIAEAGERECGYNKRDTNKFLLIRGVYAYILYVYLMRTS